MLVRSLLSLWLCLTLVGCSSRYLEVKSTYLDRNFLASQQINTPDPLRDCFQGQQLVAKWKLPWDCLKNSSDVYLTLTVRFGDRSIEAYSIPIKKSHGWWVLKLINEEYWTKQGIISYKAEIFIDETLVQRWRHHVWVDIIEIDDNNEEEKIPEAFPERIILNSEVN